MNPIWLSELAHECLEARRAAGIETSLGERLDNKDKSLELWVKTARELLTALAHTNDYELPYRIPPLIELSTKLLKGEVHEAEPPNA